MRYAFACLAAAFVRCGLGTVPATTRARAALRARPGTITLLAFLGFSALAPAAFADGSISGQVTGSGGGATTFEVDVLDAANAVLVARVFSDETGAYAGSVPAGTYRVRFTAPSHRSRYFGEGEGAEDVDLFENGVDVTVEEGRSTAVDGSLQYVGPVSVARTSAMLLGDIRDASTGRGVASIRVSVVDARNAMPCLEAYTDDQGRFEVSVSDFAGPRVVKVRLSDPRGRYLPEYFGAAHADEFALGSRVDWSTKEPVSDVSCAMVSPYVDSDADGLLDPEEAALGTDPGNPDSDADGVMDGTEMDIGTDPLDADTDRDGLSDGDEVAGGTDPNSADTDGDGLTDDADSMPTDPGTTSGQLETLMREAADEVADLDPAAVSGPNEDAEAGRRNSLATRLRNAAKAIASGDYEVAVDLLEGLRARVDGAGPVEDWVEAGPEQQALLAEVDLLLSLVELGS